MIMGVNRWTWAWFCQTLDSRIRPALDPDTSGLCASSSNPQEAGPARPLPWLPGPYPPVFMKNVGKHNPWEEPGG